MNPYGECRFKISQTAINWAQEQAQAVNNKKKQGHLNNSILKGKGTEAGFLGEYYWHKYFKKISDIISSDPNSDFYNHDILIGKKFRCEIKTKQRKYWGYNNLFTKGEASVAKTSSHQTPHLYGFTNVQYESQDPNTKEWFNPEIITLLGWMSYNDFNRNKQQWEAGQEDKSNGFVVHQDMYNINHSKLKSIKTLIKELKLEQPIL
tara:strand:- start:2899 stop:3516 length:618 start_codon:yes stop_codon:yes gene_type:complete